MLHSSNEAHKKLIECEEGNMMMHRDRMAKRQQVCAGHIDKMLTLHLHLRQHLKPKGWIIECILRSCQLPCPKGTWIAVSVVKFLYSREWEEQVQENEFPGEILSVLRRMAKQTSIAVRIGFHLLKILFTFLGPWMLTLPSPSQNNNPLVPGESESSRTCVRLSAPHANASHGGH